MSECLNLLPFPDAAVDDPRSGGQGPLSYMTHLPWGAAASEEDPESDSDTEDGGCVSPRLGRRRHHHPGHRGPGSRHFRNRYAPRNTPAELVYRDNLSEVSRMSRSVLSASSPLVFCQHLC